MSEAQWWIKGDYFENCNCDVVCPCAISRLTATPTQGHCDVAFAVAIEEGRYGDVVLDGLAYVLVMHTPGPMGHGNATTALYIHEGAREEQRQAIEVIVTGQAGGPPARMREAISWTRYLGAKTAPIRFTKEGLRRGVVVPDIMDYHVEALPGRRGEEQWLTNVPHAYGPSVSLARGTRNLYSDHGMRWDNTGKNGHYASFQWKGP